MTPLESADRTFLSGADAAVRSYAFRGRDRRYLMRDLALVRFAILLGLVGLVLDQATTMKLFLTFLLVVTVAEIFRDLGMASKPMDAATLRREQETAERFRETSSFLRKSMFVAILAFSACSGVFVGLTFMAPEILSSSIQMVLESTVFVLFLAYWYVACTPPRILVGVGAGRAQGQAK
jgi:hypothetical protein